MSEHGWRCLVLFSDSYYNSLKQLHAAPSAAAALIPLKPHQGVLASLLNRRFSSTATGSHQPRERERQRERALHPTAAWLHHSHYVQIQWNLMWRMWLAISDAVYVTVKRREENIAQRGAEARDRIKPSILCPLSNWVNAPLQPFSCPALSNGLMSAKQSHYTLNDHVFKVGLKNWVITKWWSSV